MHSALAVIRSLAISMVPLQSRREAFARGDSYLFKVRDFGRAPRLSYEDFAEAAWVHRFYICMIERGDKNVATYGPSNQSPAQETSGLSKLFATADGPNATIYLLQARAITRPSFAGRRPEVLRGRFA